MKPAPIFVAVILVTICALLTLLQPVGHEHAAVYLDFAGSVHPMVLHLPIGLWFGILCVLFAGTRCRSLDISRWLLWGTALVLVSGLCAFLSGLLLYLSGSYGASSIRSHMNGSLVFIAAVVAFGLMVKAQVRLSRLWAGAFVVTVAIGITGHLGGVITHGPILEKAPWIVLKEEPGPEVVAAVSEPATSALPVFDTLVLPILEEKCIFCHGARRAKGDLNLTSQATALSGGLSGPAIIEGDAKGSLLIKRILLPDQHDRHMPPLTEPQLASEEVNVLQWWINHGLKATVDNIPTEYRAGVKSAVSKVQQ